MNMNHLLSRVQQGEYTLKIYTWIKDGMLKEASAFLINQLDINPNSRPALSLLAYCNYYQQNFSETANYYQQLTELYPNNLQYKLNLSQSLYQAGIYDKAIQVTFEIDQQLERIKNNPDKSNFDLNFQQIENIKHTIIKLQSAIKYSEGELPASYSLLKQIPVDEVDREINLACLLYKEKKYDSSLTKFLKALQLESGFKPDLNYSIALCYYQKKDFQLALQYIGEIIEKGIKQYPELGVGTATEGIEVRSVGNTIKLQETFLIEAFNLKAAIEFQLNALDSAKESLTDMPPRSEEELDVITLHNQALINMDLEPSEGFEKLQFLIQQNTFPPETFSNLLLLYCKFEYYELAADLMAENTQFTYKYLSQYTYEFLDALITCQTSPEEAYRKLDEMSVRYSDELRKQNKKINELKLKNDEKFEQTTLLESEYEKTLELYIPILMAQAKIYWDLENYEQIEKLFRKSAEFCADNETWKLNVAHVLFMQENKFKEATSFYEPFVKQSYNNILNVSAIVLANLCVSYIITGQNEDAEELMRKIEKEEEQLQFSEPDQKFYHLCIVNLVIGTLYCSKGNYEFGISRVIKSLEPYNKKLGTDTWFYAKRCFLSLMENMAKQVIVIRDSVIDECFQFLDNCEHFGKTIKTVEDSPLEIDNIYLGKNTVTYEARFLKFILLQILQ